MCGRAVGGISQSYELRATQGSRPDGLNFGFGQGDIGEVKPTTSQGKRKERKRKEKGKKMGPRRWVGPNGIIPYLIDTQISRYIYCE